MDSFQLPHCKRRMKIQEISKKFRLPGKETEFFLNLFWLQLKNFWEFQLDVFSLRVSIWEFQLRTLKFKSIRIFSNRSLVIESSIFVSGRQFTPVTSTSSNDRAVKFNNIYFDTFSWNEGESLPERTRFFYQKILIFENPDFHQKKILILPLVMITLLEWSSKSIHQLRLYRLCGWSGCG